MPQTDRRREWSREYFKKRRATDPAFKARQAESRKRYRERLKASGVMQARKLEEHRRYTYGVKAEDYEKMLSRQNGCCAVCGDKSNKPLVIDHCHTSGAVRGLLCGNCNTGIGMFRDDAALLQKAISYLDRVEILRV